MSSPNNKVDDFIIGIIASTLGCSQIDHEKCNFLGGYKEEGRLAWGTVGDLIEASPFLPITINVPDMINGMYQMFYGFLDYIFGSDSESTPRIWDIFKVLENDMPDL